MAERNSARGRGQCQDDCEIGRGLLHADTACDVDEDVVLPQSEPPVARHHGEQQGQPIPVEAARESPRLRELGNAVMATCDGIGA